MTVNGNLCALGYDPSVLAFDSVYLCGHVRDGPLSFGSEVGAVKPKFYVSFCFRRNVCIPSSEAFFGRRGGVAVLFFVRLQIFLCSAIRAPLVALRGLLRLLVDTLSKLFELFQRLVERLPLLGVKLAVLVQVNLISCLLSEIVRFCLHVSRIKTSHDELRIPLVG